jgi:hypothetical protein
MARMVLVNLSRTVSRLLQPRTPMSSNSNQIHSKLVDLV